MIPERIVFQEEVFQRRVSKIRVRVVSYSRRKYFRSCTRISESRISEMVWLFQELGT